MINRDLPNFVYYGEIEYRANKKKEKQNEHNEHSSLRYCFVLNFTAFRF